MMKATLIFRLLFLVSERDYCVAPCTDRVPKVSDKNVTFPQTDTSATLPPNPPEMKIWKFLASGQTGIQNSKCHFIPHPTPLPPPPPTPGNENLERFQVK